MAGAVRITKVSIFKWCDECKNVELDEDKCSACDGGTKSIGHMETIKDNT